MQHEPSDYATWLADHRQDLHPREVLALGVFVWDEHLTSEQSRAELAELAGVSVKTIQRAINGLRDMNIISVEHQIAPGGHLPSRYRFLGFDTTIARGTGQRNDRRAKEPEGQARGTRAFRRPYSGRASKEPTVDARGTTEKLPVPLGCPSPIYIESSSSKVDKKANTDRTTNTTETGNTQQSRTRVPIQRDTKVRLNRLVKDCQARFAQELAVVMPSQSSYIARNSTRLDWQEQIEYAVVEHLPLALSRELEDRIASVLAFAATDDGPGLGPLSGKLAAHTLRLWLGDTMLIRQATGRVSASQPQPSERESFRPDFEADRAALMAGSFDHQHAEQDVADDATVARSQLRALIAA